MKKILFALCTFATLGATAQTKIISFKSHGGHSADFTAAFFANDEDLENDNLGMAPMDYEYRERKKLMPKLDSVIFVSSSKIILVTSNYCSNPNISDREANEKWHAGRENAYAQPLFTKIHSLDSIKKVLKTQYHFYGDIDKTVFVGYDNNKKFAKKPGIEKQELENTGEEIAKEGKTMKTPGKCKKHEDPEIKKERRDGKNALLLVLGLTIASFIGGLFMLNKGSN